MAYLTFSYLDQRKQNLKEAFENRSLYKSAAVTKQIFLSHRHKDIEYVKETVGFLQREGANIYVDYLDEVLPDKTSEETAKVLRQRINACEKFILLATPNSLDSKWIPWELGLGDRKGIDKIAILPLLSQASGWSEREYYGIYGSIETSNDGEWGYFPPNSNQGKLLRNWLTQE